MLDEFLSGQPAEPPQAWAAVMVPHAGWVYSGRLAAEVFSRVKFPKDRHLRPAAHRRRPGWAVAPYRRLAVARRAGGRPIRSWPGCWSVRSPGWNSTPRPTARNMPSRSNCRSWPGWRRKSRVVGITIGAGELAGLCRFAEQFAGLLAGLPERPLLVISSDMNHYADESRTRSQDRLALDAMAALDPARLYETVEEHQISMCGMRPAVIVMETLSRLGLLRSCREVGYTTSAEQSGDTSRVVGYAGLLWDRGDKAGFFAATGRYRLLTPPTGRDIIRGLPLALAVGGRG